MKLSDKIRYLREVEGNLRGLNRAMTQQELVRAIQADSRSTKRQSHHQPVLPLADRERSPPSSHQHHPSSPREVLQGPPRLPRRRSRGLPLRAHLRPPHHRGQARPLARRRRRALPPRSRPLPVPCSPSPITPTPAAASSSSRPVHRDSRAPRPPLRSSEARRRSQTRATAQTTRPIQRPAQRSTKYYGILLSHLFHRRSRPQRSLCRRRLRPPAHRPPPPRTHCARPQRLAQALSAINGFTITAFLCWFGGAGYLLHHFSSFFTPLILILSVLSGLAGAALLWAVLFKLLLPRERVLTARRHRDDRRPRPGQRQHPRQRRHRRNHLLADRSSPRRRRPQRRRHSPSSAEPKSSSSATNAA